MWCRCSPAANTTGTRREPFWKVFSSITPQVCQRIGENAIRGHPRTPPSEMPSALLTVGLKA
nr:MAG TPA: hypothetical protein [Caudoviricetes sp.]